MAASFTVLAVFFCLFGNLGAIGLIGPDDPRYAWIARAMAETGDWITPRLYGQPWFEKPALYYWLAAIGFRLHLPAEWAARLPSAAAALAAALAVAWLARRYYAPDRKHDLGITSYASAVAQREPPAANYDPEITTHESPLADPALLASLLWATSVAAIGFSRAATPDMLFAASLTLAMACAARLLLPMPSSACASPPSAEESRAANRKPQPATRELRSAVCHLLLGAFLALAVLAKGPAGLILAAGAILLWALLTRRWRAALRLVSPLAVLAFCVVALPWYVLCALRNPGFLDVFILQHNFARYLTPVFHHRQPFWFFGPILLLAIFPWTALLLPLARAFIRAIRSGAARGISSTPRRGGASRREEPAFDFRFAESPLLFFACWVVFPLLFFSFSDSKLPSYILPAIPALVLLLAAWLARALQDGSRLLRPALALIGLAWIALAASAPVVLRRQRLPLDAMAAIRHPVAIAAVLAGVAGASIAVLAGFFGGGANGVPSRAGYAPVISIALVISLLGFSNFAILPRLDPYLSARWHAQFLRNDRYQSRIFTYQLPRAWNCGLAFYFHRSLPEWNPADPAPALVLTTQSGLREILASGRLRDLPWIANQSAADLSAAPDELGFRHGALFYIPIPPLVQRR